MVVARRDGSRDIEWLRRRDVKPSCTQGARGASVESGSFEIALRIIHGIGRAVSALASNNK